MHLPCISIDNQEYSLLFSRHLRAGIDIILVPLHHEMGHTHILVMLFEVLETWIILWNISLLCLHLSFDLSALYRSSDIWASPSLFFLKLLLLSFFLVLPPFCMMFLLISCSNLDLGLPVKHFPFNFKFNTFVGILSSFLLKMCPRHLTFLSIDVSFAVYIFNRS